MSDPQTDTVISLLQEIAAGQAETNTLLRRIVPDAFDLPGGMYEMIRRGLYRVVQTDPDPPAFTPLPDVIHDLLYAPVSQLTAAQLLQGLLVDLSQIAELFPFLSNDISSVASYTLNAPVSGDVQDVEDAVRDLAGLLSMDSPSGSMSAIGLLQQIADCSCGDNPGGEEPPPPNTALCTQQFNALPDAEFFSWAGIELVGQGVPLASGGGTANYHVFVAVPRVVQSSALQCSISPVQGDPQAPITTGPATFQTYAANFGTAAFAMAFCVNGITYTQGQILMDIVGGTFAGENGNIEGVTERNELYTLITDNGTASLVWEGSGFLSTGIQSQFAGPGGEPVVIDPSEPGARVSQIAFLCIADDLIGAQLTEQDIRERWQCAFYSQSGT